MLHVNAYLSSFTCNIRLLSSRLQFSILCPPTCVGVISDLSGGYQPAPNAQTCCVKSSSLILQHECDRVNRVIICTSPLIVHILENYAFVNSWFGTLMIRWK